MENNIFTPGLPGYGIKGSPGGNGTYGNSIYISVLSFATQLPVIKNRIIADQKLLTTEVSNFRRYIIGDSFVDINGDVYTLTRLERDRVETSVEFNFEFNINASDYIRKYTLENDFVGDSVDSNLKYVRVANDYGKGYVLDHITKTVDVDGLLDIGSAYTTVDGKKLKITDFSHINYSDYSVDGNVYNQIWCNGKVGLGMYTSPKGVVLTGLDTSPMDTGGKTPLLLDFKNVRIKRAEIPSFTEYTNNTITLVRDIDCVRLYKSFFKYGSSNDKKPQCVTNISFTPSEGTNPSIITITYDVSDVYATISEGDVGKFKDVKFKCYKRITPTSSDNNVYDINMLQGSFNRGCVVNLPSPTGTLNLTFPPETSNNKINVVTSDEMVCCFVYNDKGWERTSAPFIINNNGDIIALNIDKINKPA